MRTVRDYTRRHTSTRMLISHELDETTAAGLRSTNGHERQRIPYQVHRTMWQLAFCLKQSIDWNLSCDLPAYLWSFFYRTTSSLFFFSELFLAERRGFIKSHLTRKTKSGRKIQNQELQKNQRKKIIKPKKHRNRNNRKTRSAALLGRGPCRDAHRCDTLEGDK
jgi:hypothetical protein